MISCLEIVHLKGCFGGSQTSNFYNWFEILDIFRRWQKFNFNSMLSVYRIKLDSNLSEIARKARNAMAWETRETKK